MQEEAVRQLAAIMFADMVGYTALMQEDEEQARVHRDRHRAIQTAAVAEHQGEILQYYGDGTLSIFPSAVEAVQCAVEIQLSLQGEELIPLRIGVHTGDIVRDQSGVYGDGVNVASRIEGLAAPGGVMVSDKVFDEIKNHPSLSTVSLGPVHLKNVERHTPVYAIANEGLSVPTAEYVQAKAEGRTPPGVGVGRAARATGDEPARSVPGRGAFFARMKGRTGVVITAGLLVLVAGVYAVLATRGRTADASLAGRARITTAEGERPTIAVLPFVNMSAEERGDATFLATGLHDELLTQLSKIAGLDVIARTSVMQYVKTQKTVSEIGDELGVHAVLEGSLMRAGDQVRLNVQLIDAETDTHIWADTYDRELTVAGVFDIQSELAEQIAFTLRAQVLPTEHARIAEVPTESLEAYTLYLRGIEVHRRPQWRPEDLDSAVVMFSAAAVADPGFALAHAWRSITHSSIHRWYDRSDARLAQARDAAEDALRIDPELPEGYLARALDHIERYEHERAAQALAVAEEGLPGSSQVLSLKSELLTRQRQWEASLAAKERAVHLDPLNPDLGVMLAMAHADLGQWEESDAAFDQVLALNPDFFQAAFIRSWFAWRRTGRAELGSAALAHIPPDADVFGLKLFFEWLVTQEPQAKAAALERIDEGILDFGGFWWAPRSLLEGWTYRTIDPPRAGRAFARAVDTCLEALEIAPGDPRIHASLGRAYAALGRKDEAVREAQRVVEILPITVDPVSGRDLLEIVAAIYAELGMAEESVDALEQVLSVPSVFPMAELQGYEYDGVRGHARFQALMTKHGEGMR